MNLSLDLLNFFSSLKLPVLGAREKGSEVVVEWSGPQVVPRPYRWPRYLLSSIVSSKNISVILKKVKPEAEEITF